MLEVLEPHGILFVQEIYVPKTMLLFGCFEIHFHEHAAVQKGVQLPEQLVPFDSRSKPPAQNPAEISSNDQ